MKRSIDAWIQLIIFSVLFILSFISNLFVIVVIIHQKRLRNKSNYLIANLAFSDLYIVLVVISQTLINIGSNVTSYSNTKCNIMGILNVISYITMTTNLMLISLHRYILIVKNLHYHKIFSTKKLFLIIALTSRIACFCLLNFVQ